MIVAFEIIHHMKSKSHGNSGETAMKIDINKAYDRISWEYLIAIMQAMGFEERWIT